MTEINGNVVKKIAIVKLSALGDVVHALVAIQFIKNQFPSLQIDWIVEASFAAVLEDNPHINTIYKVNLKNIKKDKFSIFKEIKVIRDIAKNQYDMVIDAQGLLKSAVVSKLLKAKVVGFDKNSIRESIASSFYTHKVSMSYESNAIDRNVKVISEALDIEIKQDDIINKKAFLFYKNEDKTIYNFISKNQKNILFVIGASKKNKMYSKEKFANIIKNINANSLIIWGNQEEKEMALFIASKSEAKVLPKIDLNSVKALISKVDLVIGNDTGPTHMAWALNIPSITLFGNTPGYRNTYKTNINKVIESDTKVNPLRLDKNDFSIREIEEEKIIELAKSLLDG